MVPLADGINRRGERIRGGRGDVNPEHGLPGITTILIKRRVTLSRKTRLESCTPNGLF